MWKALLAGLVAWVMIILTALALTAVGAYAHSWYPLSCCSGMDCIPIPESAVRETAKGYVIVETGEVIAHGDPRIKVTPPEDLDQGYHWCRKLSDGGNTYTGKTWKKGDTICLFVPGRGV
jgi:hypothetical protein